VSADGLWASGNRAEDVATLLETRTSGAEAQIAAALELFSTSNTHLSFTSTLFTCQFLFGYLYADAFL